MVNVKYRKLKYSVPTPWNSVYNMVGRAVELRKAIGIYISADSSKNQRLTKFLLSDYEWDQMEAVLTILHPFSKVSVKMQETARPKLERIFWVYKGLFDNIDDTLDSLDNGRLSSKPWSVDFSRGLDAMCDKLFEYYDKMVHPFAYSDAVLLDPKVKTVLFKHETFQKDGWEKVYLDGIKERYESYARRYPLPVEKSIPSKRPRIDVDLDDDDEYTKVVQQLSAEHKNKSEVERYLTSPQDPQTDTPILVWWRDNQHTYPRLAHMARDIYAVPATGAGVEREFSKSGRVASVS